MSRQGLFTKEQLARPHGLPLSTIDFYVARELLCPITLHDGTFFTASEFLRLEIIVKGKRLGFSLSEIKALIDSAAMKR